MKINFNIEFNPHEKVSYSFNSRDYNEVIDNSTKNMIYERIDKILKIIEQDK